MSYNNVTITFHAPIGGAYVKFFTDVSDEEVLPLIEQNKYLDPQTGQPRSREIAPGLTRMSNIRSTVVNKYEDYGLA